MGSQWDQQKAVSNVKKHGIDFADERSIILEPDVAEDFPGFRTRHCCPARASCDSFRDKKPENFFLVGCLPVVPEVDMGHNGIK